MKIKSATTGNFVKKSSRPAALHRYRGLYIACCLIDGMNLSRAEKEFEAANRRLWASVL